MGIVSSDQLLCSNSCLTGFQHGPGHIEVSGTEVCELPTDTTAVSVCSATVSGILRRLSSLPTVSEIAASSFGLQSSAPETAFGSSLVQKLRYFQHSGVFIAFCLAQTCKPSMSSTPEMTGMDQVQRWEMEQIYGEQMIYLVPKQSSPMPQGAGLAQLPGAPGYVWWTPQQLNVQCEPAPTQTVAPDGSDIVERRLSASAARRLRRKRAAERSRGDAGAVSRANELSIEELREEFRKDPQHGMAYLRGQVWRLSRDPVGCRVVQDALELGSREASDVANELQGHVLEAVMCPYANYVVQKVVSQLSVAASSFVPKELQGNAVRAAKHRFACRIFCRLLEFCGRGPTSQLIDELLQGDESSENLCSHSFAHHVIQTILEHGEERHKKLIAQMLLSDLWRYATHKNSSYLIEKALCYCSLEDQNLLIAKLGTPEARGGQGSRDTTRFQDGQFAQ
eukprot:Skav224226  [mRNA]  locus=scaffold939:1182574:1185374:+ [translate_table: standard]